MKKLFMLLMFVFPMAMASHHALAQEVTINLVPGWNWISYPKAEAMNIAMALGDFTPVQGDRIRSQYGMTTYSNGQWRGSVQQFTPGMGYHYYSNRMEIVSFVFSQTGTQIAVTTATPSGITLYSATCGGEVTDTGNSAIVVHGLCWGTEPSPTVAGLHTIEGMGTGSFSHVIDSLEMNTTYYVRAYALTENGMVYGNEQSFITGDGGNSGDHAYVDLGLPSGLLWATCNVGADTPEAYGDYFAWGETQPKSTYNWITYQYCNDSYNTLTKYCSNSSYGYNGFTDNLTALLPEDDAATANWGNDWRMPTKEEWQELYNNTTCTWTTQNGVNGRLFTASNGNSLFLPAAGYRSSSSLYDAGSSGNYCSSSLYTRYPTDAWRLNFGSDSYDLNGSGRYCGRSVRAVRSSTQNTVPTGAIDGKFTINENGDQVYFSQGNLQYIGSAATPYWKFADNQWDYLGNNGQHSDLQTADRDLFSWGTSGYDHGAVCYQPWSTSQANSDYYAYGLENANLNDSTGKADWGYNTISNGGNSENRWRTMTSTEWIYITDNRPGLRYAKGKLNGINGIILLPDDWSESIFVLNNANQYGAPYSSNIISISDWANILEINGAVFLPAAGIRNINVSGINSNGNYWTASRGRVVNFINSSQGFHYGTNCYYGCSVRLVHDVE